jgi:Ulp1 family protease
MEHRPSLDPPPDTLIPLQTNTYDCGVFVCLCADFIDIQNPFSFSQIDIDNASMWMAREMFEDGKEQKRVATNTDAQDIRTT